MLFLFRWSNKQSYKITQDFLWIIKKFNKLFFWNLNPCILIFLNVFLFGYRVIIIITKLKTKLNIVSFYPKESILLAENKSAEKKGEELLKIYPVYYDQRWYIGKVIKVIEEQVSLKMKSPHIEKDTFHWHGI